MTGFAEISAPAAPTNKDTIDGTLPALIAGSLSALSVACLCSRTDSYSLAPWALLLKALFYISVCFLAGAGGAWFYWNPAKITSTSLRNFTLWCGAGWMWAPAIVLLLQQSSLWAVPVAALGAAALARGLHRIAIQVPSAHLRISQSKDEELFAKSLEAYRWDWQPYVISMCFYVVFFACLKSVPIIACGALAVGVCLFGLQWNDGRGGRQIYAFQPFLANLIVAALTTAATLGLIGRGPIYGQVNDKTNDLGHGSGNGHLRHDEQHQTKGQSAGFYGYQSIVLFPPPRQKDMIVPLPVNNAMSGIHFAKPLAIPFDGAYWYFQPPDTRPSPHAHMAQGSPLEIEIRSSDFMPLIMEAHQNLGNAVPLSRCREILVTIKNLDNQRGRISIGMRLTDSVSAGTPALFVSNQPVPSSEPDQFRIKRAAVAETLGFQLPQRSAIHKFDQITLTVTPDRTRLWNGAKIAILKFELLPR